jgi:peptide/nickel transport system ATP-binding protein
MIQPLLRIDDLTVQLRTPHGEAPVLDAVSLDIGAEETVAVVGESGCGKSMLALSIMRLIPERVARISGGSINLGPTDLARLSEGDMQRLRGRAVSMVFQEPMTSLNPVLSVGRQVAEVIRRHEKVSLREAQDRAVEMLELVRLPDPKRQAKVFPHQLSGGMRQRVIIAIALACRPQVLLADEPTTALDATIQAEILTLIRNLQDKLGMALMLITHDLGIVAETANRVAVMYAGRKVEEAPTRALFQLPRHPYTRGLMRSIPRLPRDGRGTNRGRRLAEIPGGVPTLGGSRQGCLFAGRCSHATERCRKVTPPLEMKADGHLVACWESDRLEAFSRD